MLYFYRWFFPVLWAVFLLFWQIKAINTKTTLRLESGASRILRSIAFVIAIVLMSAPDLPAPFLYRDLFTRSYATFYCGAVLALVGLAFAVWAREHLGRNWSRSVTVKQDHELITTGPYALARHPIYTGILAAFLGTALAEAQVRSAIAFLLVTIAIYFKLRLEEQWMRTEFGTTYGAYAQRVRALVPFVL